MPANLTPQYKKAEERYKAAQTDEERLLALEEMLREIPKHKGTEHLQGDIKRRMSKLKETLEGGGKKGGAKHVDVFHITRGGAGQAALVAYDDRAVVAEHRPTGGRGIALPCEIAVLVVIVGVVLAARV